MSRTSSKVILDLGSPKRRKLLEELAGEKRMNLQNLISLALQEWLERQEDKEDLQAITEVESEPVRPIDELLAEIVEIGL